MVLQGPLIGAAELEARLGDPDTRVVDCRFDLGDPSAGRRDWLAGHIPGAVFADLDEDLAGPVDATTGRHPLPSVDAFATRLGELGIGNDSSVIVYDAGSGALAARAWWMLRWLGHEDVRLLERGFAGWTADARSLETGETEVEPRTFVPEVRAGVTISTEEVAARLRDSSGLKLVDARDAARYRGENEPIDPVAGHIPGALNIPFTDLIDAAGRFLIPAQLRQRFAEALGEGDAADWAVMCGSGVTACHLAVAAALAGRPEPRLYVGSWSEWIRDSDRPISAGGE